MAVVVFQVLVTYLQNSVPTDAFAGTKGAKGEFYASRHARLTTWQATQPPAQKITSSPLPQQRKLVRTYRAALSCGSASPQRLKPLGRDYKAAPSCPYHAAAGPATAAAAAAAAVKSCPALGAPGS